MKRPLIICTLALLAAAGVAQVPLHWDYPANPHATGTTMLKTADLKGPETAEKSITSVTDVSAGAAANSFHPTPPTVATDQSSPLRSEASAKPLAGSKLAQAPGQGAGQGASQASGLPPPPRNGDVPSQRSDAKEGPLQPAPAIPQVQVPTPTTSTKPSVATSSRRTQLKSRQKPGPVNVASLPPLVYTNAPAPRPSPPARRAPAPR